MRNLKLRFLAAMMALLSMIPMIGCPQQQTLASLASILGNAGGMIAAIEGNVALSAQIKTDTAAAVIAIQNWKSGTPAQEVIAALNIVSADLNLIPGTSAYAPLVDLAISTVDAILLLLPAPATGAIAPHASGRAVTFNPNAPKTAKDFKKQWNAIVSANPKLEPARL
jgi:hypothetical protein